MENTDKRRQAAISFKKAYTSLANVIAMAEGGAYCIDIMQQNLAVMGLLKSANQQLMQNHLHTCFKTAIRSGNHKKQHQMIQEILKVSKLSNK